MQVIWKTLCHQKHSVPLHAIISRKVSCVFNVRLVPWKSLSALSQAKCYIKYARKIELWSMENLKLYTLANFFIIKTIGKLLQTATLKGLVIIYHLCGEGAETSVKGFADGQLCWSHNIIYLTPLHAALYIFLWSPPFRSHLQFTDIQFLQSSSLILCWRRLILSPCPLEKPCDLPKFFT